MRLELLIKNNKWWVKGAAKTLGIAPGPLLVAQYRPSFFGRNYTVILRHYLEQSQQWSKGEMELFAAFVSSLNQCNY